MAAERSHAAAQAQARLAEEAAGLRAQLSAAQEANEEQSTAIADLQRQAGIPHLPRHACKCACIILAMQRRLGLLRVQPLLRRRGTGRRWPKER
jgi:hypothetical protein